MGHLSLDFSDGYESENTTIRNSHTGDFKVQSPKRSGHGFNFISQSLKVVTNLLPQTRA